MTNLTRNVIVQSDALAYLRTLPSESVHCCICSPPYFALRSYLPNDHPDKATEIGLEDTPAAFIARLIAVFEEVRRVLRPDAVAFINLGDSYVSSPAGNFGADMPRPGNGGAYRSNKPKSNYAGLPAKNLLGMPWRVAFALQDAGWILRSDIIWHKPNPMPEGVTDRPTKSHEYVFLLAKSQRYFYDADAIREVQETAGRSLFYDIDAPRGKTPRWGIDGSQSLKDKGRAPRLQNPAGRNARTVWQIPTEANPLAHFATYPQELVRRCIEAGCPRETCAECGAPYERETERVFVPQSGVRQDGRQKGLDVSNGWGLFPRGSTHTNTLGFRPTCTCGTTATLPGIVLDPFSGSGTTALVARRLGRDYIGCDLSADYVAMARTRLAQSDPMQNREVSPGYVQQSLFSTQES